MSNTIETATPFSESQLKVIAEESCEKAFGSATDYDHAQTESWNGAIINNILTALTSTPSSTTTTSTSTPQQRYKYAITSTIIQHLTPASKSTGTGTDTNTTTDTTSSQGVSVNGATGVAATSVKPQAGRRGVACASGAYWNGQTDGMWSFKWEQGDKRGCDVVVSVLWIQA